MTEEQDPTIVLVSLDVETTGLDPKKHDLLEVGAIFEGDFTPFHTFVRPTRFHSTSEIRPHLYWANRYVYDMHEKSGLLRAINEDMPRSVPSADMHLAEWLETVRNGAARLEGTEVELRLLGYSVDFDKRWLAEWLPISHALFSRRVVDVSQIAAACVAAGHPNPKPPKEETAHRALDDARSALDTYRRCIDLIRFETSE
jgi:oligoribonuclease